MRMRNFLHVYSGKKETKGFTKQQGDRTNKPGDRSNERSSQEIARSSQNWAKITSVTSLMQVV